MNEKTIVWLYLMLVLTACSGKAAAAESSFAPPLANQVAIHADDHADQADLDAAQSTVAIQVALVPSELVVGPNRFAVGLLAADGGMIGEARCIFNFST